MLEPNAVPVATLIVSAVSAVEKLRGIAKDSKDGDLKREIGVAYDSLIALRKPLLDLDDEVRRLKGELAKRTAVEGPIGEFGYYYTVGDREHPLCPKCYTTQGITIPLAPLEDWNGGKRRSCDACGFSRDEEPMDMRPVPLFKQKRR